MDAPRRLSDFPWVAVRVDCKLCPRRGCYRLARLAERFGAEFELDRLLAVLARDCPYWRNNPRPYEPRCGARFTDWEHKPAPTLERERSPDFRSRYTPMGPFRSLTLLDLKTDVVTIVCEPCGRRGLYRMAGLLARFGPELPLPSLLRKLAVGCPGLKEPTPRCSAVYDPAPD